MERRKFIINGTRWIMLGGLLASSGLLIFRRSKGDPQSCFVGDFCKGCSQNKSCEILASAKTMNKGYDGRQ